MNGTIANLGGQIDGLKRLLGKFKDVDANEQIYICELEAAVEVLIEDIAEEIEDLIAEAES